MRKHCLKILKNSNGYSMIELMVAVALFATGLLGIMAMEVVATKGNKDSHEMTVGLSIAEWWMERLRMEALMWNNSVSDITDTSKTPMLAALGVGISSPTGTTGWITPPNNPRFDKWLKSAVNQTDPGEYCSQYRLSTIVPEELMRAEVRVMWWKMRSERPAGWQSCPTGMLNASGNPDITRVQSVAVSSLLWRHSIWGY